MGALRLTFLFEDLAEVKTPLARFAGDFLNYCEASRGLAENTIIGYGRRLIDFTRFCRGHGIRTIEQLRVQTVLDYFEQLKRERKASGTIALTFYAIKEMVKFAILSDIDSRELTRILTLRPPKTHKKLPEVLSVEQVKCLLDGPKPQQRYYRRDRAILALLYGAGLRTAELTDLRISDVDLVGGIVRVRGKGSKERLIPVLESVAQRIREYLLTERKRYFGKIRSDYLFPARSGGCLDRHDIWRLTTKHSKRVGLPPIGGHVLRHSFATHSLMGGADLRSLQLMLGHSSIATTEVYLDLDVSYLATTLRAAHPLAQKVS